MPASVSSAPELLADGAGGAFLMWLDDRARAFHITGAGTVAPGWPSGGLALGGSSPALSPSALRLLPSGDQHLIAMWYESGGGNRLVMQRAGRDGTLDPAWPAAGFTALNTADALARITGVADGQGGMTLVWLQSPTNRPRALRVVTGGTLAAGWPVGGVSPLDAGAVWTGSGGSIFRAATGRLGGLIFAWNDGRLGGSAIRARWLSGDGQPDAAQPDEGRIANPVWPVGHILNMTDDGAGGAFISWQQVHQLETEGFYSELSYLPYDGTVAVPAGPAPARLELVSLAPNPVTRDLTVRFRLAGDSPARIELLDLAGRRLRARDVRGGGEQSVRFEDLRGIEPGLYLVHLAQGGRARTSAVVVVK